MIFSIHYFLWFSAITSIYGFMSVYAKHYANASATLYGLLNMILPFLSILAKLFFCSLADRKRAHRTYFIIFLIVANIGYGSFAVLPLVFTPRPEEQGLFTEVWILICIMALVSNIAMSVLTCFSDAFAVNHAKRHGGSYGRIRVWGTIGWGISAFLLSYINQYEYLPKLEPGLILMSVLLIMDLVFVILWPNQEDFRLDKAISEIEDDDAPTVPIGDSIGTQIQTVKFDNEMKGVTSFKSKTFDESQSVSVISQPQDYGSTTSDVEAKSNITRNDKSRKQVKIQIQLSILMMIIKKRKSLLRYMILFILSGAFISMQWSYFFLYLEQIYGSDFEFTSGISMVGQSMLGELPFFILSKKVIELLGRPTTLSVTFITIGLRYLLYIYLLPNNNVYYVLATEWFQGPNFGLFYVVMTEIGSEYSECTEILSSLIDSGRIENNHETIQATRSALKATMQALVSGCYEGLGLGIGSIVGGAIIDSYDFKALWSVTAYSALTVGVLNICVDIFLKYKRRRDSTLED